MRFAPGATAPGSAPGHPVLPADPRLVLPYRVRRGSDGGIGPLSTFSQRLALRFFRRRRPAGP